MSREVMEINNQSLDENNPIEEICGLHEEIQGHAKSILQKAIRIGELLVEQKQRLQHGKFGKWIEDNLPFHVRTAQIYMDVFRNKDLLKSENISLLTDAQKFLRLSRSNFKEIEGEGEKKYLKTFSFFVEQKEVLDIAIQLARELRETRSDSESIYRIAYEWSHLMLNDYN